MKGKGFLIGIIVIIAIVGMVFVGPYNRLVDMDESVKSSWGQIENQMKRRADLIPNLVEVVKGYASHESEVISSISEARKNYSTASTTEEYAEADENLNAAIRNLNVIVENYPDLKADKNFQDLQAELAGTENRIATERMRYNESVENFNKTIRRFPTNIVAGIFNFEKYDYFKISEKDAEVPSVKF